MSDGIYDASTGRPVYRSKHNTDKMLFRKQLIEQCANELNWNLSEFFMAHWGADLVVDNNEESKIIVCNDNKIEAFEKINGKLKSVYEKQIISPNV